MAGDRRALHLRGGAVDLEARVVRRADGDRALSPLELELLRYLAEQQGRAVPREELLHKVWGYRSTRTRTLATTVRRLREKIEIDPGKPNHLLTAPGGAYRLELAPIGALERPSGGLAGRERERAAVDAALSASPVVTLTGLAGVGKSRLAAEIARGNTLWVDLVGATDRGQILERLAAALGQRDDLDIAALTRAAALRGSLAVLDGADDAVEALSELLPEAGGRWLVTSRQPLQIRIEREVRLEGLPLEEAAALFAERTGIAVDDDVKQLVEALDGNPLAIEIAASWVPLRSVREIAARGALDLENARRDAPLRHRSLRAAVEDSWRRLGPREREVLRALATFAGDAPREAIEPVAGAGAARVVRQLAERSLVQVTPRGARVYRAAAEHAAQREPGERWERAHADWIAKLGTPEILARVERGDPESRARLEEAREDLALAAERTGSEGAASALALIASIGGGTERAASVLEGVIPRLADPSRLEIELAALLRRLGRLAEAERRLRAVLGRDTSEALRARALQVMAQVQLSSGDLHAAEQSLSGSIAAARAAGDTVVEALALGHLGFLRTLEGRPDAAQEAIEQAIAHMRASGQRRRLAMLLSSLAQIVADAGRDPTALYREALGIQRALQDRHAEAVLRIGLGDAQVARGELDGALQEYQSARESLLALGSPWLAARAAINAAGAHLQAGRDEAAEALALEVMPALEAAGDKPFLAVAHAIRAMVALTRGELDLASIEIAAARQYLGPRGDTDVEGIVAAANATIERLLGRSAQAVAAAERASGEIGELLRGGAPPDDPRWVALAERGDEHGRLARAILRDAAAPPV